MFTLKSAYKGLIKRYGYSSDNLFLMAEYFGTHLKVGE
jgi:hypothetical protein